MIKIVWGSNIVWFKQGNWAIEAMRLTASLTVMIGYGLLEMQWHLVNRPVQLKEDINAS